MQIRFLPFSIWDLSILACWYPGTNLLWIPKLTVLNLSKCCTALIQCIQFIKTHHLPKIPLPIKKKISDIQLNSFNFTKLLTLFPCRTPQLKWSMMCHPLVCVLLKFNNIWSKFLNGIDFKHFPLVFLLVIGLLGSGVIVSIFSYEILFQLYNKNYCMFSK